MKKMLLIALGSVVCLFSEENCMPKSLKEKSITTTSFLEFLEWKYISAALVFGRDGINLAGLSDGKTGTSYTPHSHYDPGFRAGIGCTFGPNKAFDTVLRYTWFYTNPKREINCSSSFLPLNWMIVPTTATYTNHTASMNLKFHYYYPEMQLGYTFIVNPYLTLRSYMALTSIVIDGELKVQSAFTDAVEKEAVSHGKSFSWSIGPKLGLDFIARFIPELSLYCGVNFTQQCAQITMKTTQTSKTLSTDTTIVTQKGHLNEIRSIPLFGLEIGPVWDARFCKNRYHFQLRPVWQISTLSGGNLSFLNNNNVDIPVGAELRGFNIRALFEF